MEQRAIEKAASLFGQARLDRRFVADLPAECVPPDEASAYDIQDALYVWLGRHGLGRVGGYKVGLVSAEMRKSMGGMAKLGVDSPVYGGIVSSAMFNTGASVPFDSFIRPYVEGEFAVRIGTDIPATGAPYTRNSIGNFVGACLAGMELVDWRLKYFDYPPPLATLMLADGGSNWGSVTGIPVTNWQALDIPTLKGQMRVNGRVVGGGKAGDLQGHPFEVLAWLANRLIARGRTLSAGDFILLGSVTPSFGDFGKGAEVVMSWEGLGDVAVTFT